MNQDQLMKLAIVGAMLFGLHKFGGAMGKVAAVAVGAVAIGKQLPYVSEVV
jgi:uncharacterized protein YcfJ